MKYIGLQIVPVDKLYLGDYNPRRSYNKEFMKKLTKNVKDVGVFQTLLARKIDDMFEVIAGSQRLKALQVSKTKTTPVYIVECNDYEALLLSISENTMRRDPTPIEEAEAYYEAIRRKIESCYMDNVKKNAKFYDTPEQKAKLEKEYASIKAFSDKKDYVKELSKEIQESPVNISKRLKLLFLPKEIQNEIHQGTFESEFGLEISRLRKFRDKEYTREKMLEAYYKIQDEKYMDTLPQLKAWVNSILRREPERLQQLEEDILIDIEIKQARITELKDQIIHWRELIVNQYGEVLDLLETQNYPTKYKTLNPAKLEKLAKQTNQERADIYKETGQPIGELDSKLYNIDNVVKAFKSDNIDYCNYCFRPLTLEELNKTKSAFENHREELTNRRERIGKIADKLYHAVAVVKGFNGDIKKNEKEIESLEEKIEILKKNLNYEEE